MIQNIFAKYMNEANSFDYSNFLNLNRKTILQMGEQHTGALCIKIHTETSVVRKAL